MAEAIAADPLKAGREEWQRYVDACLRGFIIGDSIMDEDEFNRWTNLRALYELDPERYSE